MFFFQAEDGIRGGRVTGVQTCALPICRIRLNAARLARTWRKMASAVPRSAAWPGASAMNALGTARRSGRSEERRVGKEGRSRCEGRQYKNESEKEEHTFVRSTTTLLGL